MCRFPRHSLPFLPFPSSSSSSISSLSSNSFCHLCPALSLLLFSSPPLLLLFPLSSPSLPLSSSLPLVLFFPLLFSRLLFSATNFTLLPIPPLIPPFCFMTGSSPLSLFPRHFYFLLPPFPRVRNSVLRDVSWCCGGLVGYLSLGCCTNVLHFPPCGGSCVHDLEHSPAVPHVFQNLEYTNMDSS